MENIDRFKSRVWDLNNKKMRYDINIMFDQNGNIYEVNNLGDCFDFENLENDNFVRMQSTGKRDENRKLIFESDVLIDKETKLKHLVIYFKTAIGCIRTDLYKKHGCCSFGFWLPTDEQWLGMEIIGNKFENPELLPARQAGGKGDK